MLLWPNSKLLVIYLENTYHKIQSTIYVTLFIVNIQTVLKISQNWNFLLEQIHSINHKTFAELFNLYATETDRYIEGQLTMCNWKVIKPGHDKENTLSLALEEENTQQQQQH